MGGQEIRIGPFVGGLNALSDASAIGDTELTDIVNFELDEDGSLVNRPPIVLLDSTIPTTGSAYNLRILGFYTSSGGVRRLIATNGVNGTYWFNGTVWASIISANATAVVQYRDDLWLIVAQGDTAIGGRWNPTSGFVAVPNIPRGMAIISHKDRLWIAPGKSATANGSRLMMSNIVAAAIDWPASPNFLNISAGDGQNIVDLVVYNSDIVIFKERSTYRFAFTADPSLGSIQRTSATIGAADYGCVAEWQNQLFVLFDNKVFEFSNYLYDEINAKVPLETNNPSALLSRAANLSAWADRLIVNYYNTTYVYSIKFRVWTKWKSSLPNLEFMGNFVPDIGARPDQPSAYVTGAMPGSKRLYRVTDAIVDSTGENMLCTFRTKNYDYDSAAAWKRLFMAHLDVISNVPMNVIAHPVSFARQVTWAELKTKTWAEVKLMTWGRLTEASVDFSETVSVAGSAWGRKVIKTLRSVRFRQIAFSVGATTQGNAATSPLRIFSLTTFVKDKQYVSKKIS